MTSNNLSDRETAQQLRSLKESPHRGSEVLLRILGALLIGYLVNNWEPFIVFLKEGSKASAGEAANTVAIWVAYLTYVVNVFRQIYGLGIFLTDKRYSIEVAQYFTASLQFFSLLASIAVLAVPFCLVSYINTKYHSSGPLIIILAYTMTALAYLAWDLVT